MTTDTYNCLTLLVRGASLIVAILAALGLYKQIKHAAESLKTSSLMAVLALEDALAQRRSDLAEAQVEVARFAHEMDSMTPDAKSAAQALLNILQLRASERLEQYLNTLDRLCACIVRGNVDEEIYRQDYRGGVQDIVNGHADRFGANTRHPNVVKVHVAWRDDKSARDPRFGRSSRSRWFGA